MSELVFCKLGGSVITDKARPGTARHEVIARLAGEVARSLASRPELRLVLGHGSGSFGHVVARQHGTRHGVGSAGEWRGFTEVAAVAARLNRIVSDAMLLAGVPVLSLQPSASAECQGGQLASLAMGPVEHAVAHGLVPIVYGDVALDSELGGTIVSTEQLFAYMARQLHPARLVLVTAVDGVFERDPLVDPSARAVPEISASNWREVQAALGGSVATDVTGGMLAKVEEMVALVREFPGLAVRIISGERQGSLETALREPMSATGGTVVTWTRRA
jgi:isopentenyl phosphate kinase